MNCCTRDQTSIKSSFSLIRAAKVKNLQCGSSKKNFSAIKQNFTNTFFEADLSVFLFYCHNCFFNFCNRLTRFDFWKRYYLRLKSISLNVHSELLEGVLGGRGHFRHSRGVTQFNQGASTTRG